MRRASEIALGLAREGFVILLILSSLAESASAGGDIIDSAVEIYSSDISIVLADIGIDARDLVDVAGSSVAKTTPPLPIQSNLTAYHMRREGNDVVHLLALDVPTVLESGETASPRDVIQCTGEALGGCTILRTLELPRGVGIDGITQRAGERDEILLTVDADTAIGDLFVGSSDLVVSLPEGAFALVRFQDIPAALNMDAVHALSGGGFLASFDTAGGIGDIAFEDQDVLLFGDAGEVSVFRRPASLDSDWEAANLDALFVEVAAIETPTATTRATDTPTTATTHTPTNTPTVTPAEERRCVGDCTGNEVVTIDDLKRGVGIALKQQDVASCRSFDADMSGQVEINELVTAVVASLQGCEVGSNE